AWAAWAEAPYVLTGSDEPKLADMPPMLRRRAGFLGRMALEVAYRCINGQSDIPVVFCSRHGEVARAVELLSDLVQDAPLSPTAFGLAVHNASAGLFSIARADRANHVAIAAGGSSVEHAVIEACGLLADGAEMVLLVSYDDSLPPVFAPFEDCREQPHAWAWLMVPAAEDAIRLSWTAAGAVDAQEQAMPPSLEILRFQLQHAPLLERVAGQRRWRWSRHA
ncbi:MAG TPA: beta-ketoacyl synthase chain length factor, partial [Oxalicibacterium sp.]|nr:beta-ketoacyl synthase chain length factor [Oxalicibacterium sp.]